jgi:hypothetical protein
MTRANECECRDWKGELKGLLGEIATAAGEGNALPGLRRRFRVIWREACRCAEFKEATRFMERGVAYARRLLIAADLNKAARDIYPEQLMYRRVADRVNGRWLSWAADLVAWVVAGHGLNAFGLARLFLFIVVFVLGGFALLYRFPEPRIAYRDDAGYPLRWYHYVYFSGKTLTTLGFGDITPRRDNPAGMLLAVSEGVIGYVLLGTFIFALTAFRRATPPPEDDWEAKLLRRLKE